ncbi:MAG: hypothetical protein KAI43_14000 [Candidatus Aureabacteria bacterium]|nr:hypothetical protein [Candidatus Auribacterota bacterium]
MKLNLVLNDYSINLDKELNEEELKKNNFKKAGFFDRLFIKTNKDEIIWWAKNCSLKYLNDNFQNSIYPILDIKAGAEMMFGTSAYLRFKKNKLTKFTFQIIQNKMAAEISLKKLKEKLIEFVGNPTSSESPFITWETENQKFTKEYPQRMHGYIHLMNKNL